MAASSGGGRAPSGRGAGYAPGAAVVSVGIGLTGLITYTYFSLASHSLSASDYGGITLLWSAIFLVVSVLYRPVEQLLSRTIADQDARGRTGRAHLRVAATIQLALGVVFAVVALALRGPLEHDLLGGSATRYWVLIVAVLAYAASYFARGFLAGTRRFALYGGLQLMESSFRCLFALAVAVGLATGESVVALGMAAAPILSLAVVPFGIRRGLRPAGGRGTGAATLEAAPTGSEGSAPRDPAGSGRPEPPSPGTEPEFTLSHGSRFAAAVLVIMASEQTFLNAGPLVVNATSGAEGAALAGFVFNALLIARAPLQLFQAVQTSILPHLTGLRASGAADPFRRSVNATLLAIGAFAAAVALAMLALGPTLMDLLFGSDIRYSRVGLVVVAVGMGVYLAAATLNQAALAQARAGAAALCWAGSAAVFVGLLAVPGWEDRVLQVEASFLAAALLVAGLLYAVYRRGLARGRQPAAGHGG